MTTFTITNIPAEVYLVALDLMGQERPADPADALELPRSATDEDGVTATVEETVRGDSFVIVVRSADGFVLSRRVVLR